MNFKQILTSGMVVAVIIVLLYFGIQIFTVHSNTTKHTAIEPTEDVEEVEERFFEALPSTENNKLLEIKLPKGCSSQYKEYTGFVLSFNIRNRVPNYVAYELTKAETQGTEPRAKGFMQDESVKGCPTSEDYKNSGYDRGHMAPAGDMKWSEDAMHDSFYMTNICPQKKALNGGAWKRLEEKVRDWAQRDGNIIVVTGPIFSDNMPTIGEGVAVPQKFFKALLEPNSTPVKAIGFIYKNEGGQKIVGQQAVCIDEIERQTGLDLFNPLPDELENKVEQSCNYNQWNN